MSPVLNVYERELTDAELAAKVHRDFVGGLWEDLGRHQFDFLVARGLKPRHRLLDVGCGALRGGIHFMRYLEPGNYYGMDSNASLLKAAREIEMVEAGVVERQPHLLLDAEFAFHRFGAKFSFALAQSVFTHLPDNQIEMCLINISAALEPGGKFYATYFPAPRLHTPEVQQARGGPRTFLAADPYHQHVSLYEYLLQDLPLRLKIIGDWAHPRGQHMLEFTRA
jgi:SAM-dependent methyltransferase